MSKLPKLSKIITELRQILDLISIAIINPITTALNPNPDLEKKNIQKQKRLFANSHCHFAELKIEVSPIKFVINKSSRELPSLLGDAGS